MKKTVCGAETTEPDDGICKLPGIRVRRKVTHDLLLGEFVERPFDIHPKQHPVNLFEIAHQLGKFPMVLKAAQKFQREAAASGFQDLKSLSVRCRHRQPFRDSCIPNGLRGDSNRRRQIMWPCAFPFATATVP